MQYVRNLSDSVSTAWNSINPATLSGAIDVIVVEREDGTLACSPFHVRFGKFSLLRPSDKKVEFKVNGDKQDYSMKLGEGGEAFFVFETSDNIPESMQTSPLVSPVNSPPLSPEEAANGLQDPDPLELDGEPSSTMRRAASTIAQSRTDENGMLTPLSASPNPSTQGLMPPSDWAARLNRPRSDDLLRQSARASRQEEQAPADRDSPPASVRSQSPPPLGPKEALERAMALSKGLSAVNIPTHVTETGDLMLDMTGFKSSEEDMLRAELLARNILSEEMDGNYDIGALFGFDEEGNLWVYSSEDAKQAAMSKTLESSLQVHRPPVAADAVSDPGYQSDGSDVTAAPLRTSHRRAESDAGLGLQTPPLSPMADIPTTTAKSYAKTLRLTSEQLKELKLKPGQNSMSFTVNRATCTANLYLWKYSTPVVISDIDGTITKSDALGHVLNMIGRDWTHSGIAKLYSDIALNGYNIMYLTSRSVGQADTTRAYLYNIAQEGFKMPPGPTILSPDRTMAALRREVYLRKPHVFKMATLRDIRSLYGPDGGPFYAGFGNRLTDQISYRTVDVPRTRIFTINSNSEVSLDLLSLNKLKMTYVNINEVVDHYFPPIDTLVRGGREEYTDFMYWRDDPLQIDEFSASEDEDEDEDDRASVYTDDEEEEMNEALADSYISTRTVDEEEEEEEEEVEGEGEEEEYDEEDEEEYDDDDNGSGGGGDDDQVTEEVLADMANDEKSLIQDGHVIEDVPAELITGIEEFHIEIDRRLILAVPVEIRPPEDSP